MQNDWITIGEAADLLQVSRDTLRRWEKKGKITSYRSPSNRRMYKKSEITQAYQQSDDDTDETTISDIPSISLTAQSYQPNTFTQNPRYTITPNPISNPFTELKSQLNQGRHLSNLPTSPHTSHTNPQTAINTISENEPQELKETNSQIQTPQHKLNSTSNISLPIQEYKKPHYLKNIQSNQSPAPNLNQPSNTTKSLDYSNETKTPEVKSNISPYSTQQSPSFPNSNIPLNNSNTPLSSNASSIPVPQNKPTFSYPSIINTNTPNLNSNKNYDHFFIDEDIDESQTDNTIKILKIITAILITILIVLGISIFSIIFMQYR